MTSRRILPPPPRTQALSSTTFCPPPLDGSLSLPEQYDWHLDNNPKHRLFVFAKENGGIRTILWQEAVRATYTGTKILRDRFSWIPGMTNIPIVAVLAASDSIPYLTTVMAIMRAGYAAFTISIRNSPAAVAHLINQTGTKHILVSHEQAVQELVRDAFNLLKKDYPSAYEPGISPMLTFEELYLPAENSPTKDDLPFEFKGPDAVVFLLHSSGSTAFPKPIRWTNTRILEMQWTPMYGERDLTDVVFSFHSLPMFHAMGSMSICWTACCGFVVGTYPPNTVMQNFSADSLLEAAKDTNCDVMFCVPSVVEAWSRNREYVKWLSTRTGVISGGGPLAKVAGDYLVSKGVSIFVVYGLTETGYLSIILPTAVDEDWEYFKMSVSVDMHMIPSENNTFRLVVKSNDANHPAIINTTVAGVDAIDTFDLLIPHPNKPDYWKVFGRADDQIVHSNGEKTNPGPLEGMLNQDEHVSYSVVFGSGRFQAGVLVEPKLDFQFDPNNEAELAAFRNAIWPTVKKMNDYAPQHSRLFKEMILVVTPSKPFSYTAKNTPRRQAIIDDYAVEIEALYQSIETTSQTSIQGPSSWNINATMDFVRVVVRSVIQHAVSDTDDLFQHGCDSLQATWIRNSILRALRESAKVKSVQRFDGLVYDNPSIARLASFVSALASGDALSPITSSGMVEAMRLMAAKYSAAFPVHCVDRGSIVDYGGDCVLITGTTGALGSYLLARAASDPAIARVYAVNRASRGGKSLHERQKIALLDRGIDIEILQSTKVRLIEADVAADKFNLPQETYDEMRKSATHIIHNAWRVDFNIALSSFEQDVKGVRALIDFALSSPLPTPPRLIFTSTIGVFFNFDGAVGKILPEAPVEPEVALGNGYVQSKWVSEEILSAAFSQTSLKPLAVRVGQICGGPDGSWNMQEWFPSLVQSTEVLGCFPQDDGHVSWVPVDIMAAAVIDFRKASESTRIVHLIHPRPVSWSSLASVVASAQSVPLVSYVEWLAKLEAAAASVSQSGDSEETKSEIDLLRNLRSLRILPFFKAAASEVQHGGEAMGFPGLDVTQAVASSATLADPKLRQLDAGDVRRWLAYWRKVGLLASA